MRVFAVSSSWINTEHRVKPKPGGCGFHSPSSRSKGRKTSRGRLATGRLVPKRGTQPHGRQLPDQLCQRAVLHSQALPCKPPASGTG